MRSFFPISVSNSGASSSRTRDALLSVVKRSAVTVVFIADRLQAYNYAAMASPGDNLAEVFDWRSYPRRHLQERRLWVERMLKAADPGLLGSVEVVGYNEAMAVGTVNIYRNISILYATNVAFRNDVDESVARFTDMRLFPRPKDVVRELSKLYILEEIAVNLEYRTRNLLDAEFYIGAQIKPLHLLYGGKYGVSVETLTERDVDSASFRFYCWRNERDNPEWEPIEI